jgi:hypothetical protein
MSIAFIYFLTTRLIADTFLIMLGIAFLMFGSKNREHNGTLMIASGILIVIGITFLMVFRDILYLLDWLANMPFLDLPFGVVMASIWLEVILGLVAVTLFLVYTINIKKVFLIISAAFFVTVYTLTLFDLIGVFGFF